MSNSPIEGEGRNPTVITTACDCIRLVNDALAKDGKYRLRTSMNLTTGGDQRMCVELTKRHDAPRGTRASAFYVANFCPVCGAEYAVAEPVGSDTNPTNSPAPERPIPDKGAPQ